MFGIHRYLHMVGRELGQQACPFTAYFDVSSSKGRSRSCHPCMNGSNLGPNARDLHHDTTAMAAT